MKKLVIIKPNCREPANHLWNYLSIYAYGIETGARVCNPAFIAWHRYFTLDRSESFMMRTVARLPILHSAWRLLCALCGSYLVRVRASCVRLTLGIITYLPPTRPLIARDTGCETTYFIGWHFRNPAGLERHRDALCAAFTPRENICVEIEKILAPLRGKTLVGVHLRGRPFPGFANGDFLVSSIRVRRIVGEYLRGKKSDEANVALVVVSDTPVDPDVFRDLTTYISHNNDVTNLFLLSKCSVIIGANSTFANLAAWFGNVPHLVTTNEPIDWEYYRSRPSHFENKYATFAW